MVNSSSTSTLSIERVNEEALSLLSRLLQTVAKALEHKGQTLWTQESLEPSALTEAYPNADMYLALQDGDAVEGFTYVGKRTVGPFFAALFERVLA